MGRLTGYSVRLTGWIAALFAVIAVGGCGSGGGDGGGGSGAGAGGGGSGGSVAGLTPPIVTSTVPANTDFNAPLNRKIIATFSKPMSPASINSATFVVKTAAGATVSGNVSLDQTNNIAIFAPTALLLATNTQFNVTITTGAKDLAGTGLAQDKTWFFFTTNTIDATAPAVMLINPANGATGVGINKTFNLTFSEAMDSSTITTTTLSLTGPGATPVAGTVRYDSVYNIATFIPSANLAPLTTFTGTLTAGAKDLAGNSAGGGAVTFTTGAAVVGQAPVALGTASGFAVLSGTTVTNTGPSTITGDVGVSPGTSLTGFPPGTVLGSRHSGDAAAAQAQADLTTAFNDAAGRTGFQLVAGDLGLQTKTPGLYRSTSALAVTAGNLTLDAQGDATAVFIFQVANSLAVDRQITLVNGARATNIFWQVGASATLGTNSVFEGSLLADQSITVANGATLEGRALARNAAVTLDSVSITTPAP